MSEYYANDVQVTIRDKTFAVRPIKVKHLGYVYSAMAPVSNLVLGNANPTEIQDNINSITLALSKVYETEVAWFEDLTLDEIMELLNATIKVNSDFFIKSVLPKIHQLTTAGKT